MISSSRLRSRLHLDTAVASSAAGSAILRAIAPILNLATSILLARMAGPREFGVYAYCLAIAMLVVQPVTNGLATVVVRHVAAYYARGEWGLLRGTLRRASQAVLAGSVALIGVGIVIGAVSAPIAPGSTEAFAIALLLIPLFAANAFRGAVLRGLHHIVWGQLPEQIVAPVTMLSLAGAVAAADLEPSARTLITIHVIAVGVAYLVGSVVLRARIPSEVRRASPVYEDRRWLKGVLPLTLVGGSQLLSSELGVILVGHINGAAAAGIFRVTLRGAELVSFVLAASTQAVGPMFSRLYALNDVNGMRRLAAKTTRVSLVASLVIALPMILAGGWILRTFYGPGFDIGATALAILCLGQLVNVTAGPVGSLLAMTGHERELATGTLLSLAISVVLTAVLASRWGLTGAAAGIAIGLALKNAVHCWFVFRRLKIGPHALAEWQEPST